MRAKVREDGGALDFEALYRRHRPDVRAVVLRFHFVDAAADDLIQDIFIQAWQDLANLKEPADFKGWLMTISRNRCVNEVRKSKRNLHIAMTDAIQDRGDGNEMEVVLVAEDNNASIRFELSLVLLRQLVELHDCEPRATVARQFYLDEKSVKEIAEGLVMNQNTVLSHLRRFRVGVNGTLLRLAEEKGLEIN